MEGEMRLKLNITPILFASIFVICSAHNAFGTILFQDLEMEIPKNIGYKVEKDGSGTISRILFLVPSSYFKYYNPYSDNKYNPPIPITMYVNGKSEPYSLMTDEAEIYHLNNWYVHKNLTHERDGDYEVYTINKFEKLYISQTPAYPHKFQCSSLYKIQDPPKYYCDVGDHLFNEKWINGSVYRIHYQISDTEILTSKEISREIKHLFYGMIKNDVTPDLTNIPERPAQ
jgi:hypothetical protein